MMKRLLPQANNLDTVIKVFVYACNKINCTQYDIASFCGFEPRQSAYYLNACYYLGLIESNGTISELGKEILANPSDVKLRVYELIINDVLIGEIFAHMFLFPADDNKAFAVSWLKKNYPDYSDAVIERRASTLLNWCEEILCSPLIEYRTNK